MISINFPLHIFKKVSSMGHLFNYKTFLEFILTTLVLSMNFPLHKFGNVSSMCHQINVFLAIPFEVFSIVYHIWCKSSKSVNFQHPDKPKLFLNCFKALIKLQ